MNRIRLKAPGGLENFVSCRETPPEPGPGEILVRIRACSLNYRDLFFARGTLPLADGRVPLSDGAGEVLALGEGVDAFQVGDDVVGAYYPGWLGGEMTHATPRDVPGEAFDGFASEFACMPASSFTRVPAGYTALEAATLPCAGVTAWRGLMVRGRLKPGDTVLTLGTGSVSLFALQLAKAAGARVIATSSSEEKLDRLRELGADALINYRATPDWGERARALTDGRGVDQVIEVGGPATLSQSIAACRIGGHVALIGVLTGFVAEVSIPALFSNQIRLSGISIGSRADQEDLVRALEANAVKPVIDRAFPLGEIGDAFRYYERRDRIGKVCLAV